MSKSRINIAIIEPSHIFFVGLSNLLHKTDNYYYIFRLTDLDELNLFLMREKVSFVLLNPCVYQNKNGDLLKMKKAYPEITWIGLLYSFYHPELLSKLDDTILATDSLESIIGKLTRIAVGQTDNAKQETLSEREIEVLAVMVKGFSNKEIAEELNISIHTVISHRKNIVEKTGIKSLSGLTIYAISKKYIQVDG